MLTIQQVLIPGEQYQVVDVQIEADRITAIAPQLESIGTVISGQDKLLLPGFVNAHTHSSQVWQRGLIPQLPLELWLAELYDSTPSDLEQIYLGALSTAVETLLSGGTCVMDHLSLVAGHELETVAAVVRAYQQVGIRGFIAPLIQDQPFAAGFPAGLQSLSPKPYQYSTEEVLALMEAIVTQFHQPDTGISIAVGPTGFHRCSDALLQGCAELSDRHNLCRHAHLLETKAQKLLAQEKYAHSAVEHLRQIGYLGSRTSLAHCVWLSDPDIATLAETQSTVVHNPISNLRLGSGIAPILKCRHAGVNVAFGCDGAASNDSQDLLEAIKLGCILHNTTDFDYHHWITPHQAVEMAALGGAKGLNLGDQCGSLAIGKKADLVLYDLTNVSLLPHTDPIGLLVLGRPTGVVDSVWVNGTRVVTNGQVTGVDLAELRQQFHHSQQKAHQPSQTLAQVEAHYRQVMKLP